MRGRVLSAARNCGADLAGVASIERFSALSPEAHPASIKPDCRSVIVLGFRIPRGALRGIEEATAWQTVSAGNPAGSIAIEATYQLCRFLESDGWEAVPLTTHSGDFRNQGVRSRPDRPEPNVIPEMEFAAHAAGLGEIGRGKFFLTPEFGPRQFFTAVLTDCEIEPDRVFSGKVCDDCGACADACPARALDRERIVSQPLAQGTAAHYCLRIESCRVCQTGVFPLPYSSRMEPCRIAAACGRACVAHLEDERGLSRKFKFGFRKKG